MRRHVKVYCMMATGKPLTPHVTEVLFINSYEMWNEKKERQELRSRRYFGYMTSNLLIIEHMGIPCVEFESVITEVEEEWGVNQVRFIVRIDDLNVPPNLVFATIKKEEEGPIPMDFYRDDDEDDEPEYDLGEPTYG